MKSITIKRETSTLRRIAVPILTATASSAVTYATHELMRRRSGRTGRAHAMPGALDRLISRDSWDTPINQRPQLLFNKGNISQMLGSSDQLDADSPAAAIAMMGFLAEHQNDLQLYARSRLTKLLGTSDGAIRSDRAAVGEAKQFATTRETVRPSDEELTSQLTHLEWTFRRSMHGAHPIKRAKLSSLATDLSDVAAELSKLNSQRRQASTRIILAYVYLQMGKNEQANQEMSQALVLIGNIYGSPELIRLSTEVNGQQIIDLTYEGAPDGSNQQQHAHDLAANSNN